MYILKKFFFVFIVFIFVNYDCSTTNAKQTEDIQLQYKVYVMYPADKDMPKILYMKKCFGGIKNVQRQLDDIQTILFPGTYLEYTDYTYNAYQFELESVENEICKKFYCDFQNGKYFYVLITIDNSKIPNISLINEEQGKEMLKKLLNVSDLYQ